MPDTATQAATVAFSIVAAFALLAGIRRTVRNRDQWSSGALLGAVIVILTFSFVQLLATYTDSWVKVTDVYRNVSYAVPAWGQACLRVVMVPTAIGMATTVRVGHAAGAGLHSLIELRAQTGIVLGVCFGILSAATMILAPGVIVGAYTDLSHLAVPAMHFLFFAAVFQVFDCIQATANGALRGLKDTRIPMMITVLAYWVAGMPLAVGLSFHSPVGPDGVWWGFIAGLVVAAIGLGLRLRVRLRSAVPAPIAAGEPPPPAPAVRRLP